MENKMNYNWTLKDANLMRLIYRIIDKKNE